MRPLNSLENTLILIVLGIAVAGLFYAAFLARQILAEDKGSAKMQEVWNYIRTGANAYLRSQLRIIATLIVMLVVALFFSVYVVNPTPYAIERFCPDLVEGIRSDYEAANPIPAGAMHRRRFRACARLPSRRLHRWRPAASTVLRAACSSRRRTWARRTSR